MSLRGDSGCAQFIRSRKRSVPCRHVGGDEQLKQRPFFFVYSVQLQLLLLSASREFPTLPSHFTSSALKMPGVREYSVYSVDCSSSISLTARSKLPMRFRS